MLHDLDRCSGSPNVITGQQGTGDRHQHEAALIRHNDHHDTVHMYTVIVFLAQRALINALQSQFRQITQHQIATKYLTLDHFEVARD